MKKIIFLCMLFVLVGASCGCSVKSKPKEVPQTESEKHKELSYTDNTMTECFELECTYKQIDFIPVVEKLTGITIDESRLVIEKKEKTKSGSDICYIYKDGKEDYSIVEEVRSDGSCTRYLFRNNSSISDESYIDYDFVKKKIGDVLSDYLDGLILSDGIIVGHDDTDNGEVLEYRFVYNGIPLLGNRNIDNFRDTSFIEVEVVGNTIEWLEIYNLPECNVIKNVDNNEFVSKEQVLSMVDDANKYPGASSVKEIALMYMPFKEGDSLVYKPVYEIFFTDSRETWEDAETMLIDAYTGVYYD